MQNWTCERILSTHAGSELFRIAPFWLLSRDAFHCDDALDRDLFGTILDRNSPFVTSFTDER